MVQCFQSSPAPLPLLARLLQCPLSAAIAEAEVRRLVVVLHAMQTQTQEGAQRAHVEWHWRMPIITSGCLSESSVQSTTGRRPTEVCCAVEQCSSAASSSSGAGSLFLSLSLRRARANQPRQQFGDRERERGRDHQTPRIHTMAASASGCNNSGPVQPAAAGLWGCRLPPV